GGTVFSDTNGNGLLDSPDSGLAGFTVRLYESTGGKATLVGTAVTGTGGEYTFSNLNAGTYYAYVTNQTGKFKPTGKSLTYYQVKLISGASTGNNFGEQAL